MQRSEIRDQFISLRDRPRIALRSIAGYWLRHFSVVVSASENASSVRSSRSGVTDT